MEEDWGKLGRDPEKQNLEEGSASIFKSLQNYSRRYQWGGRWGQGRVVLSYGGKESWGQAGG